MRSTISPAKWRWAALAVLLLAGAFWPFWHDTHVLETTKTDDSLSQTASDPMPAAQNAEREPAANPGSAGTVDSGASTTAATKFGAFFRHRLRTKVELLIPEGGVEARLIAFLESPSPVHSAASFTFDRVSFETGSATLQPASQEQLKNIAEILKAYPLVTAEIGAHTDNTGSAEANLQLSTARATNVMNEVIKRRIFPDRLSAKGYGGQQPIADNSTEDGRGQNRRLTLRITK